MVSGRCWPFLLLFLAASFSITACSDDPPDKEIQQAQTAIDAAKAAGAEEYAHDEFAGAQESLKHARDAVADRDYRLALTSALDSRERAQSAATQAADQKLASKSAAERAMAGTLNALADANAKLKAAQAAHLPAKTLKDPLMAIADADAAVQKAGAAFQRAEYLTVTKTLEGQIASLSKASRDLGPHADQPAKRRR